MAFGLISLRAAYNPVIITGGGSVLFDAASSNHDIDTSGNPTGVVQFLHTPVASSPSGAIGMLAYFNGEYNTILTSAKYGAADFAQNCVIQGPVGSNIDHGGGAGVEQGNYWKVHLFGLPNPPPGAQTVTFQFSGLDIYATAGVVTVTGSDLAQIFRSTGVTSSGTGLPSLVIPSASGDLVIDVVAGGQQYTGSTLDGKQVSDWPATGINTRRWAQSPVAYGNYFSGAGSTALSSGSSVSTGWGKTGNAGAFWLACGASIKASIAALNLSSNTTVDNASINTVIGSLSVSGGTGTYTYTLTSNPGGLFNILGSSLRVNAALTVGSDPITVQADNGAGSVVSQSFTIVVSAASTGGVTGWNRLKIGGGGFVYSGSISNDGVTQTVNTDSGGALVSVSGGEWTQVQRSNKLFPSGFTFNGNTRRSGGSYTHVVAPSDHTRVYLMTQATPQTGYGPQLLYVSNDGGATYNQTTFAGAIFANENDGQYRVNAPKLAVDPHNKDIIIFTTGGRTNNFNGYVWNAIGAHTKIQTEQSVPHIIPTGSPVSFDAVPAGMTANAQYKTGVMASDGIVEILTTAGAAITTSGSAPGGGNISLQATYYSTDGGQTCTLVNGVPMASATGPDCGLAFDPSSWTSGNTPGVYLFHQGSGLYKSTTGVSGTFTLQGTCPTTQGINGKCSFDGTYYVANEINTSAAGTTGAFRWKAGAWTTLTNVTAQIGNPTAVCPSRTIAGKVWFLQSVAFGGGRMVVSADYGSTCSTLKTPNVLAGDAPWLSLTTDANNIAIGDLIEDPITANKLWLMAGTGVFYSTDQTGSTVDWTVKSDGIEELVANRIICPWGTSTPVLGAWDRSLFKITDPTQNYQVQCGVVGKFNRCTGLDWASTVPTTIAAINNADQGGEQSGISADGGATWSVFPTPLPAPWIGACGASIAAASPTTMLWVHMYSGGVHYTRNGGITWTAITNAQWGNGMAGGDFVTGGGWNDLPGYSYRQNVTADRVLADTFYIQNAQTVAAGGGIYKVSFPSGVLTISRQNTAYANPAPSAYMLVIMAVPEQASTFFISSGDGQSGSSGLQWSFDGGINLYQITGIGEVYAFGFGVKKPTNDFPSIYVVGFKGGVFGVWRGDGNLADWKAGSNTGTTVTWTNIGIPLFTTAQIKSVTGDGLVWGRAYVATNVDGCFFYKP